MIYSVVGTSKDIREKAFKELKALGPVSLELYSEHIEDLESAIDAVSLFGDDVITLCIQLGGNDASKEMFINLLPGMKASANIFIIDEPFADVHLINRLTKVSKKLYNGKEEKIKDTRLFTLAEAFVARDKKHAWSIFMEVRNEESGESIQGVLWWKFKTEWQKVKEGRKSLFTPKECEVFGAKLVTSVVLAHRGKANLMEELEKLMLSL